MPDFRGTFPVGHKTRRHSKKARGSGWTKELGLTRGGKAYAFKPDSVYKVGNTEYQTDVGCARVKEVRGYYVKGKADRGPHQTKVGKLGLPGDCGGHWIRSANGGSGEAINMTPMGSINAQGGAWANMENEINGYLNITKKRVYVEISAEYPTATCLRASKFTVKAYPRGMPHLLYQIDNI